MRPSRHSLDFGVLERWLERYARKHSVVRGLLSFLRRLLRRDVATAASAMAFDFFLAAIPMLALSGWLTGKLLRNSEPVLHTAALLLHLTPNEVEGLVWGQLDRFALGTVAPLALAGALWIASGAFHTSLSLMEVGSGAGERPWWRRRLIALGCVLCAIVTFALSAVVLVWISGGPSRILDNLSGGAAELDPNVAHWLLLGLMPLVGVLALGAFFYVASPRAGVRRRVLPGACLAVGVGVLASLGFAFYAAHLAKFALFYGSLATVAVTLAWLWLVCFAVLTGAELNQWLEGRRLR